METEAESLSHPNSSTHLALATQAPSTKPSSQEVDATGAGSCQPRCLPTPHLSLGRGTCPRPGSDGGLA